MKNAETDSMWMPTFNIMTGVLRNIPGIKNALTRLLAHHQINVQQHSNTAATTDPVFHETTSNATQACLLFL